MIREETDSEKSKSEYFKVGALLEEAEEKLRDFLL